MGTLVASEDSVPASSNKRSGAFYRPELDALRFFACLCVFVGHVAETRHFLSYNPWISPFTRIGSFGVCLFFLLSAYLITELLWKERDSTGSIHLKSFYVRRILRIWPLYFACILLMVILSPVVPRFVLHKDLLFALLLMVGNWYCVLFGWPNWVVALMWSISVEEQFYVLVPSIAKFFGKRAIWTLSIIAILVSQVTLWVLGRHHAAVSPVVWANSLVQFQYFAAGCILALTVQARKTVCQSGWTRAVLFGSGLFLWIFAGQMIRILDYYHVQGAYPFHRSAELGCSMVCAAYGSVLMGAVLLFISVYGMPTHRIPGWMIYLGKISYGLYLFQGFTFEIVDHTAATAYISHIKRHFPIADILFEIVFSLSMAALSYRYFEKPFLRLKNRFTFVHSRPA